MGEKKAILQQKYHRTRHRRLEEVERIKDAVSHELVSHGREDKQSLACFVKFRFIVAIAIYNKVPNKPTRFS